MATIKSYTNLQQSKKLAEILPLESADMLWEQHGAEPYVTIKPWTTIGKSIGCHCFPCWSLATLLEQFPYEVCDNDGKSYYLKINKDDDLYQLEYVDPYGDFESIETDSYEHFVDTCVAMIEKLNELKML